jgi:hypothetical protein
MSMRHVRVVSLVVSLFCLLMPFAVSADEQLTFERPPLNADGMVVASAGWAYTTYGTYDWHQLWHASSTPAASIEVLGTRQMLVVRDHNGYDKTVSVPLDYVDGTPLDQQQAGVTSDAVWLGEVEYADVALLTTIPDANLNTVILGMCAETSFGEPRYAVEFQFGMDRINQSFVDRLILGKIGDQTQLPTCSQAPTGSPPQLDAVEGEVAYYGQLLNASCNSSFSRDLQASVIQNEEGRNVLHAEGNNCLTEYGLGYGQATTSLEVDPGSWSNPAPAVSYRFYALGAHAASGDLSIRLQTCVLPSGLDVVKIVDGGFQTYGPNGFNSVIVLGHQVEDAAPVAPCDPYNIDPVVSP